MRYDSPAAEIEKIQGPAGPLVCLGAWPPHWPEPATGRGQSAGVKSGVVIALKERTKLSSGSQYFTRIPLIWN